MKTAGHILFAIGLTLFIGGIASYFLDNVELDFYFGKVNSEKGRLIWIVANLFIVAIGFFLIRLAKRRTK